MLIPAPVAVIGGGCAGLAAAATLAQHGVPVTLFEASPELGGRARGLDWGPADAPTVRLDNGQHILLGAYSETLRLLALAGVDGKQALLRLPLQLHMHAHFELRSCHHLPAPLHILCALLTAPGLSWRERWAALKLMGWAQIHHFELPQDQPLARFLAAHRQPPRLVQLLWEPLCLAALNTPLASASSQVFLNVLRDSFANRKQDSDMLLARSDLSTLLAEPLAAYIEANGGEVRRHAPVAQVLFTGTGSRPGPDHQGGYQVNLENGNQHSYRQVILAVSPFRLAALATALPALAPQVALAQALHYQPICTVYIQYPPQATLPRAMTGLVGTISQWVFDRGQICGQAGLLAVVISAEGTHQQLSQPELAQQVITELASAFPQLPAPIWHKVIAEKRATFACDAGLQRPSQTTDLPGCYLAGDYVAGQYPATIEGGVRSGVQCALQIIAAAGLPLTPLQHTRQP